MPVLAPLAIAMLWSTISEPTRTDALSFQPRARAVLMVVTPKGTASGVASATLFDAASAELERRTDLELESMERSGVDVEALRACPSDQPFGCWINALARAPQSDARTEPRVLLVVSLYPVEQGEYVLHSSLIDLPRALRSYVRIRDQGEDDWLERVEDAIYGGAVHAEPARLSDLSLDRLRTYFAERFDRDFEPLLESGGHVARLGEIAIDNTPDGLQVAIDGQVTGQSRAPRTHVADIPIGMHEVRLTASDGSQMQAQVTIDADKTAHLEYIPPPPPASVFRVATFWTAVALGTAGAALSIVAAVQGGADVQTGCVIPTGGDASACPNAGLPTLGFAPSASPTADLSALNPGGPSTAALGLGLLGAGAVTATTIALFGEREDAPWLQIASGLAVGLATFAIVSVADPRASAP